MWTNGPPFHAQKRPHHGLRTAMIDGYYFPTDVKKHLKNTQTLKPLTLWQHTVSPRPVWSECLQYVCKAWKSVDKKCKVGLLPTRTWRVLFILWCRIECHHFKDAAANILWCLQRKWAWNCLYFFRHHKTMSRFFQIPRFCLRPMSQVVYLIKLIIVNLSCLSPTE